MLTGDMTNVLDIHMANGCKCKMKESKIIGFCHCRLHKGYLNASILKEHECLRKNCFYLEKYEDRPFWVQREKAKENKLKSKEKMKALGFSYFKVNDGENCDDLLKKINEAKKSDKPPLIEIICPVVYSSSTSHFAHLYISIGFPILFSGIS